MGPQTPQGGSGIPGSDGTSAIGFDIPITHTHYTNQFQNSIFHLFLYSQRCTHSFENIVVPTLLIERDALKSEVKID